MESENPYASFDSAEWDAGDRLLLTERAELTEVIRQYLDDQTGAFDFDEKLQKFIDSNDSSVRYVAQAAWYHYDDFEDHHVTLTRQEWGYFQRLLLLLESNCRVETSSRRRWSWTQLAAAASLLAFAWLVASVGWGQHLLVYAMPFGVVSILLARFRNHTEPLGPYAEALYPFASFTDLKTTYDSVGFRKQQYPKQIEGRAVRSPLGVFGMQLQFYANWLMFAPIALLAQMFPTTTCRSRVVVTHRA